MRSYISDYDKALLSKCEQESKQNFIITEEFEQRIYELCKREEKKRKEIRFSKNNLWFRKVAVVLIMFVTVISAGAVTNASTDGKVIELLGGLLGAIVVNDETRELVGKEIVDNNVTIVRGEDEEHMSVDSVELANQLIKQSHIIEDFEEKVILPVSIHEFEMSGEKVPEVIMTNGVAAVFHKKNYEGWKCRVGDRIVFDFRKYKSGTTDNQALIVGYIRDGVMYHSENAFAKLRGRYELEIKEDGEYHIYIISATSDYLTLQEGRIKVE